MYDMDVSDCIDKISLKASKCTLIADLPVQDNFLLSVLKVSLGGQTLYQKHRLKLFHTIWTEHSTVKNW